MEKVCENCVSYSCIFIAVLFLCRFKERIPTHTSAQQFSPSNSNVIYSGAYSDPGYLQMALGAYLTPSSSVYKSVDPYFLSQGEFLIDFTRLSLRNILENMYYAKKTKEN